jgi:uncharacterized protein (TIGR03086 family)
MPDFDLPLAAHQLAALVTAVPEDALAGPTPCADTSVAALLDHVGGLSLAFTLAATKEELPGGSTAPSADADHLPDDWRTEIPGRLRALASAWESPDAWEGMTMAGPIELPAPIAALVTLDELMIHGWDLARATDQPYAPDRGLLEALHGFVSGFAGPGKEAEREGLFGPEVPVPADAPLLDRVVAMTGRDPSWTPA